MKTKIRRYLTVSLSVVIIAVVFLGTTQGPPLPYYGTYLGGSNEDMARSIALNISRPYVTGYTYSNNFPTTPYAFDTSYNGDGDAFVTKLHTVNSVGYSTYLGGSDNDMGYGIVVDSSGNAYVTGSTNSNNFPTVLGSYDTSYNGGGDIFVTKLNTYGSALIYSTFIGGTGKDFAMGIALDSSCNVYITGQTYSNDFPTTIGAYDRFLSGPRDAFVVKLNSNGAPVYSTYLGGSSDDGGNSIAVDSSGNAYVTGFTWSTNFPTTPGANDTTRSGNCDAFVTKLNSAGSALSYSTYLGGSVWDHGHDICVHPSGCACVTGMTDSTDFLTTTGAYQPTYNGGLWDGFVTMLNSSGTGLLYSTYLGGSNTDWGESVAIEPTLTSNIYVTGITRSSNFPTTLNAYDTSLGGTQDAFVSKLSPGGNGASDLFYSSYLGGSNNEHAYGIAEFASHAYVAGGTWSNDFPTSYDAWDRTYNGGGDAFVSRLAT